ncbi:hypothetical protein TRFO_15509 [Tritrichomonas foetus]|uniref:Uncharacterized protein n=1 Tax=Tritrichomonas foetus TaxID=1144522 RepID=A0A1J4KWY1_9EUKA|nr:hypothetical protein TRFO_15509 [Tritrichomonas foetus]|eukprot:OHT14212.1 hypothetical protein TRFO_15509 [Tritrichomonas foetus]
MIEFGRKKKPRLVSITNFDRQAKCITFTEPETIEAIRRLGYIDSDFNFREVETFKTPATDIQTAAILHQRFLTKRQKMIEKTIKMRISVIDEKKFPEKISPIVRVEEFKLNNYQKQLEKLEENGNLALEKLAIMKLHDLFCYQTNLEKNQMIKERFKDFDQLNQEKNHFVSCVRKKSFDSNDQLPKISCHESNYSTNSMNHYDYSSNLSGRMGNCNSNGLSLSNWHDMKCTQINTLKNSFYKHEEKIRTAAERKEMIDQKNHSALCEKIQMREDRFKCSSEITQKMKHDYLENKGKMIKKRAKSVRKKKEDIIERKADSTYFNYLRKRNEAEQKLKQNNIEKANKVLIKKYNHLEKIEKAKHKYEANNYNSERIRKRQKFDTQGAQKLIEEQNYIGKQKTGANIRLRHQRNRLSNAIDNLENIYDFEGIQKVQLLLGVDDDKMNEIVHKAMSMSSVCPHNRKA